jgi:hypothetical protein
MAHAETRDGKLTGRWVARVRTAKAKFPARFFDTKASAELYETLTKATGVEPPQFMADAEPEGARLRRPLDPARVSVFDLSCRVVHWDSSASFGRHNSFL